VIPVAGVGTQLRPHTYTQPKSLIPVAGKPILSYIIDQLLEVGITEFVFVIGYLGEKIKEYVDSEYPKINKNFVFQEQREGLGHAIWLTKEVISSDSSIIIVLGDTILDANLKEFIKIKNSALGVKRVDNPSLFGVAQLNEKSEIIQVIEKPKIPKSNMALVGLYKIDEYGLLIEALEEIIKKKRKVNNEYLLTDAIMTIIRKGYKIDAFKVDNWYDCGQKEVLLQTNALLLKNKKGNTKNNKLLKNTIIIEPVVIGKNAVVQNSIIGPNITIGENAVVKESILRDSIIGSYTNLSDIILQHSLVGNDTVIKGSAQSLNIGDNTALDLR
ncbi:MAG: glucose-1-phosphate thymidylyltransferase, partial [Bacteroidetes bacterium]|nr:glucose-1-phosphate thymidylyltransferase [Bacteroidota bacterium]